MVGADNRGAIKIACNDVVNESFKHIEVRYHFLRDHVKKDTVKLPYVETAKMVADVMTKLLQRQKHSFFREAMGLHS